jgi:hypothetical protein
VLVRVGPFISDQVYKVRCLLRYTRVVCEYYMNELDLVQTSLEARFSRFKVEDH